jgi:uncharacterized protein
MRSARFSGGRALGIRLVVLGALAGLTSSRAAVAETPIPAAPARWATDRAAFLSPPALAEIDARLASFGQRTGHQVLVYVDHTTGGAPIDDWAVRAFENWKVGRRGMDDGLVLFIFADDHALRIETGYGLEARVPDATAARIINELMVPRIRVGDRDGAVRAGVGALLGAIGGVAGVPGAAGGQATHVPLWQLVLGVLALVALLGFALTHPALAWMMLLSIGSGRRGGGGGGGFSGGGGRSGGGGASGSW